MSTWMVERQCTDCGEPCLSDVDYPQPRCGPCWITATGASHSNAQYRVRPPRVELSGRGRPGRYINGHYVYWDEPTR